MDDLLGPGDARNDGFGSWPLVSVLLQIFGIRWHRTMYCRDLPGIAIVSIRKSEFRVADAHGILEDGSEYRLKIAWRAADNLEHLRRGRFLLQRFVALTGELSNVGLCFVVGRGWIA
jgi:hypothetical protein